MPYLKIPKKISDRFSLKNVYVSVLVFSVNSKNLNIGCTARFGEIKEEKIVIATSGEKTIAHACSGKTPGSSARAPTGEYVNDKQSNICLKKKFVQRVSPAKKIPAQGEGEKKKSCKLKIPLPPPHHFSNGPSLRLSLHCWTASYAVVKNTPAWCEQKWPKTAVIFPLESNPRSSLLNVPVRFSVHTTPESVTKNYPICNDSLSSPKHRTIDLKSAFYV